MPNQILDKFYEGNSEFHYTGLMEAAVKTPNADKLGIVKSRCKSENCWRASNGPHWRLLDWSEDFLLQAITIVMDAQRLKITIVISIVYYKCLNRLQPGSEELLL
ncbi:hypothetical protein BDEG_23577 [Batrachochytrium dendrobatidis JEL423]|uniref:Uncharacterized protein n=1 Tax=Batrachochytrium dendrobatidis (strain JEL423) TaxID=403673 RepID=A0A177WK92_BATDL|nr:hypothetical protein BDEG_23577 [Batrachochytrium dendrobatidis JEL423]